MLRILGAAIVIGVSLVGSGCSGGTTARQASAAPAKPARCPQAWKPGWQRLADRVDATVYCPTWMPSPLDGQIGGQWDNGVSVDPDRSYLVSFLWHEPPAQDVHVNFRGYPGRTAIPLCEDVEVVNGKTRRRKLPCFSDSQGRRRIGRLRVTVYTVNQGVDQWHVLYAWRAKGSLYTASEHVAKPLTYRQVTRNLDRLVRGLDQVSPGA